MGLGVLIIGKSGSGKSTSLRNFDPDDVGVINVIGKPLPFRNNLKTIQCTNYNDIKRLLMASTAKSIVIDDAGYLITDMFMRGHSTGAKGNQVFELFNSIADEFYYLIRSIDQLPQDKIVYFIMHEDKNDYGDITPKTIGKMLSEKVDVAGLFTICLRCVCEDGEHKFLTQTSGSDVAKSPIGMFPEKEIDNDLKMVDDTIRSFYGFHDKPESSEKTKKLEKGDK